MDIPSRMISDEFSPEVMRYASSWCWLRSDFAAEYDELSRSGALREDGGGEVIWETRKKYVLKLTTSSGRTVAFKSYRRMRKWIYLLHPTPTAREAVNFQRLAALGVPMVKLLGVGEIRRCFQPEKAFLVTEFALGFRDGRSFCPGGEMAGEEELRREFCIRNFRLLARLHDHGIIHGGFTPANELWHLPAAADGNGGPMELAWIDVATCRRCTAGGLQRHIPDDFANFMRFFDFSAEERLALLREYCDASEIVRFTPGELAEAVDRALAARTKKRK